MFSWMQILPPVNYQHLGLKPNNFAAKYLCFVIWGNNKNVDNWPDVNFSANGGYMDDGMVYVMLNVLSASQSNFTPGTNMDCLFILESQTKNIFLLSCIDDGILYLRLQCTLDIFLAFLRTYSLSHWQSVFCFIDCGIRYFAWNTKEYPWNSTQDILSIHWK